MRKFTIDSLAGALLVIVAIVGIIAEIAFNT
jgi:hypothetical protein